jgi:hypothetical protein
MDWDGGGLWMWIRLVLYKKLNLKNQNDNAKCKIIKLFLNFYLSFFILIFTFYII